MSETVVRTQHVVHDVCHGLLTEITFGQGILPYHCNHSVESVKSMFYAAVEAGMVSNPSEIATWLCENIDGVVEVRVTTTVGPGAIAKRIPKGA